MRLICQTESARAGATTRETRWKRAARFSGRPHAYTFAGMVLFTILLYVRPNELFPDVFGTAPIVKVLAIGTVLLYVGSKASRGESISIWPIELKMVLLIFALGVLFAPLAASPGDSIAVLSETFSKVAIIFLLMINVVDSRDRLLTMLRVVVVCGTWIALAAARDYTNGLFLKDASDLSRVGGVVGGIFGNANDLATALAVLVPIALALFVVGKGFSRAIYLACAAALVVGVFVTLSRTGFLGLVAMGGVMVWKLGRERRAATILAAVLVVGAVIAVAPGGYADRVETILNIQSDQTGSAQERRELMVRAAVVALYHPVVGVGMGNYHTYSIREKVAHNAYLEIAAELGVAGLLAYLVLIFAPFRSLRRIEREALAKRAEGDGAWPSDPRERQAYVLAVALQASLAAYAVCSYFASIEYQWLLYYLVAHAVSLRQIYATAEPEAALAAVARGARTRGLLWKPYQQRDAGDAPVALLFQTPRRRLKA